MMKKLFYFICVLFLSCSKNDLKEEFTLFEPCPDLGAQWPETVFPNDLILSPSDLFDIENIKEYLDKKDEK
jgi:hypothetical protein